MNKLFTRIMASVAGFAMAIGVGVGVSNKKASPVFADSTYTIGWGTASGTSGTYTNFTEVSGSVNGILSFSTAKNNSGSNPAYNSSNSELRLYYNSGGNGGSITIEPASGITFTGFVMTTSTTPSVKYAVDGGTATSVSASNNAYTVSGISVTSSLVIQNANTTNTQLRIKTIELSYTSGGGQSSSPLSSIALSGTYPTSFTQGDEFSHAGMTVTATYEDESTANVTAQATFSGYNMNQVGNQTVTVSYTENKVTKTATYGITVNPITYSVTYDSNGATSGDVPVDNNSYVAGASVTVLGNTGNLAKTYYTFAGWSDGNNEYSAGDSFNISSNVTLTAIWNEEVDVGAVTYDLSQMTGFDTWGTSYNDHNSEFTVSETESAVVTIKSSNHQTGTITDIPVSKGGDVTFVLNSETRYIKNITFHARQWGSKAQTMTLHTSSNKGTAYTSTEITSSTFTIRGTNFSSGTNAVKVTFSSPSDQVGYENFVVTYDNLPTTEATSMTFSPASLSILEGESTSFTPSLSGGQGDYEKTITWESSHPSIIATPADSEAGVAVNVTAGAVDVDTDVTITGTVDVTDGATASIVVEVRAIKTVSVESVTVSGIQNNSSLDGTNDNAVALNRKIQLSAVVNYQQGGEYMDGTNAVSWLSSDSEVATVDSTGLVLLKGNGTVTITATSVENNAKSNSLTFSISNIREQLGSENNPYTVAQALAAIDANDGLENAHVKGIISRVISYSSNSITYYISDDGTETNELEVFKGKGLNGANFSAKEDIEVGAIVLVKGTLTFYNNTTYEFSAGSQQLSYAVPADSKVEKLDTQASLSYKYTKQGNGTLDTLDCAMTGVSGTGYASWSGKVGTSGAVYAGQSAAGNSAIQLRTSNNNSGVITTTSGGNATKVSVVWNSNTASGRTINIYGKDTAYSAPTDLYDDGLAGDLIGQIQCGTSTELAIANDYEFIGIRSDSGALYLDKINIQWGEPVSYTFSNVAIRFGGAITPELWNELDTDSHNIAGFGVAFAKAEDLTGQLKDTISNVETARGFYKSVNDKAEGHPDSVGGNYVWNLYLRISTVENEVYTEDYLNDDITAVAYIKLKNGEVVFLKQTTASVSGLASALIADTSNDYTGASFEGSLGRLASL